MKEIKINEDARISLGGFTVNPEDVAKHVNDINPELPDALIALNKLFTIAQAWNKEVKRLKPKIKELEDENDFYCEILKHDKIENPYNNKH